VTLKRAEIFVASDLVDLDIESIDIAGDGVARRGRSSITVPFTIPGERVRVRLDGRRFRGTVVEILRPSPHRVTPRCSHFGQVATSGPCGGCAWQHIAYQEQLRLKTHLVERLVTAAVRGVTPMVRATLAATPVTNPWGYRNKVHFVFGQREQELLMGHYARESRRIIHVHECPVHDPRGNAFAFRLRDELIASKVSAADITSGRHHFDRRHGTLRHVVIRTGVHTREMMTTLVVTHANDKRLRAATRRAFGDDGCPGSVHLNLHERADPSIFGPHTQTLIGPARMREEVAGMSFLISATTFFQTQVGAAEHLVRVVLDALPAGVKVLDLYAGAGLFALPLARRGHRIIAIEENGQAVADGIASLRLNRIRRDACRFIVQRVETALRRVSLSDAEAVVLDPPREGCSASVINSVFGHLHPQRAVYVSCNPEALARDLAAAVRHGYQIDLLQPIDMFPHTAHIETVAVMSR
jgi:23S rRNA (uracil1939-C5)-methyltransferase